MPQKTKFTIPELHAAKTALIEKLPDLVHWAMIGIGAQCIRVGWQRRGKNRPVVPGKINGVPTQRYWVGEVRALASAAPVKSSGKPRRPARLSATKKRLAVH